jgi:hypothetical protein
MNCDPHAFQAIQGDKEGSDKKSVKWLTDGVICGSRALEPAGDRGSIDSRIDGIGASEL